MKGRHDTTPNGKTALKIGISSVIAAVVLGIGSLGYYGLGFSSEESALSNIKSGTWAESIKNKINASYMYLFFSFYICVISGSLVFSEPLLFKIFSSPPMVLIDFVVQTLMQNGRTLARLNNEGYFSAQRMVWILYCSFLGAVASPVFLLGMTAARISVHVTCVMICFLIIFSFVAPVGKFIAWKQSLSMSEIGIFIASIGAALFPITSTAGAIFFSLSFYGGLILYPISFVCHSQETQVQANQQPESDGNDYCSIAMSVPMLLDVISIFGRVVVLVPPS